MSFSNSTYKIEMQEYVDLEGTDMVTLETPSSTPLAGLAFKIKTERATEDEVANVDCL
jgi:hypothetical protein